MEKKEVNCICGETTPFSSWVFAHWDNIIEFDCPKCDKRYTILRGDVKLEDFEEQKE